LRAPDEKPDASLTQLAMGLGWRTHDGKPSKSMAPRKVNALTECKLTKGRDGLSLTPAGQKALEKLTRKSGFSVSWVGPYLALSLRERDDTIRLLRLRDAASRIVDRIA